MGTSQQATITEEGLRRIAIVLSSLPPEMATELVEAVDGDLKEQLEASFQHVALTGDAERRKVLGQFSQKLVERSTVQPVVTSSSHGDIEDQFQLGLDLGESKKQPLELNRQVSSVVTQWDLPKSAANGDAPFAFLDDVDDDMVVQLLKDEHTQTIALVFASITPKQAARLLPRLDGDTQAETIRRIEKLDDVSSTLSIDVARHLKEKAERLTDESATKPGHHALQAIMEAAPHEFEEVFEPARSKHPKLPDQEFTPLDDQIREVTSVNFEADPSCTENTVNQPTDVDDYLCNIRPQTLCRALGHVQTRDALLTLCGLPHAIAERTISLLPRHKARTVRSGMRSLCSVRLVEIDESKAIVAQACVDLSDRSPVPTAA